MPADPILSAVLDISRAHTAHDRMAHAARLQALRMVSALQVRTDGTPR